jgi:hypothetical protein
MHARRNLVVARLEAPRTFSYDFIWKDAMVKACGDRCEFRIVNVDVATRNVTQPSDMIEVQVPEEH